MKRLLIVLLAFIACSAFSQSRSIEIDTIRTQGYLFTEISISSNTNKKTSKTVEYPIDNLHWNFFIPLSSDKSESLKTIIEEFNQPNKRELYLAMNLTDSESRINSTNFGLNKIYSNNPVPISINSNSKDLELSATSQTVFKIKNDKLIKRAYKVSFIDGVWLRVKIPWKWKDMLGIGSYKTQVLDPQYKEGYYYYFLIETKIVSSELDLNDVSIEVINSKSSKLTSN